MLRALPLLILAGCAPAPVGVSAIDGFALPLLEPEAFYLVIGVDHGDEPPGDTPIADMRCTDYLGRSFPHCYRGHNGVDFSLTGDFTTMDAGSSPVVAAADGVVISAHDGEYDRCRATAAGITCDGFPMRANQVVIAHDNGLETRYWHLKRDSVVVEVGQVVRCGQPLGLVGSSGYSSFPHLHFEVTGVDGDPIDPYAGPYSQPESLWRDQGPADGMPAGPCNLYQR